MAHVTPRAGRTVSFLCHAPSKWSLLQIAKPVLGISNLGAGNEPFSDSLKALKEAIGDGL